MSCKHSTHRYVFFFVGFQASCVFEVKVRRDGRNLGIHLKDGPHFLLVLGVEDGVLRTREVWEGQDLSCYGNRPHVATNPNLGGRESQSTKKQIARCAFPQFCTWAGAQDQRPSKIDMPCKGVFHCHRYCTFIISIGKPIPPAPEDGMCSTQFCSQSFCFNLAGLNRITTNPFQLSNLAI